MAKKIDWTNHIIEFVTVVIGILLAFALNNYTENKRDESRAFQYMEGIKNEIEHNLDHLEEKLNYHTNLLKELQTNPLEVRLQLKLPKPKNYAWKLAENEIFKEHTDVKTYYLLAEIYSLQEVLLHTNEQAGEAMVHLNVISPYYYIGAGNAENAKSIATDSTFRKVTRYGWIPIFQDVTSYESELIQMYKNFLTNN